MYGILQKSLLSSLLLLPATWKWLPQHTSNVTFTVSEDDSSFLPTLTKSNFPAGEQGYVIFFLVLSECYSSLKILW